MTYSCLVCHVIVIKKSFKGEENSNNVFLEKDGTLFLLYGRTDFENMAGRQFHYADTNFLNLEKGIHRYDVGVDANYMAPVSAEDLIAFFQMKN